MKKFELELHTPDLKFVYYSSQFWRDINDFINYDKTNVAKTPIYHSKFSPSLSFRTFSVHYYLNKIFIQCRDLQRNKYLLDFKFNNRIDLEEKIFKQLLYEKI